MPSAPDFTNRYNTYLPPQKEEVFQAWLRQSGRAKDLADYDLRGAWLAGAKEASNGHFPDTYKKPNHPTFSDESIYSGVDGYEGGHWKSSHGDTGPWTFEPSDTNLKFRTKEQLQEYFKSVEPDSSIAWDAINAKSNTDQTK